MSFFKEDDKKEIKKILEEKLTDGVTCHLFIKKGAKIIIPGKDPEECPYCDAVVDMFSELKEIDDRIDHETHELGEDPARDSEMGVEEVPAIVFTGKNKGQMIFYGIPSGYEFASLLEVLGAVSSDTSPAFSPEMTEFLVQYEKKAHIRVFVTPTCPYCPPAAVSALLAARLNKNIRASVYEVSEFSELGKKYNVEGVPKTVINETVEIKGGYPEKVLREKLEEL